jgi:hypothetical protein
MSLRRVDGTAIEPLLDFDRISIHMFPFQSENFSGPHAGQNCKLMAESPVATKTPEADRDLRSPRSSAPGFCPRMLSFQSAFHKGQFRTVTPALRSKNWWNGGQCRCQIGDHTRHSNPGSLSRTEASKAVLRALMSIERSAGNDCGCFQLPDVYIKFPDGSLRRPDIAVFGQEPPDTDEVLERIPEAIVEVLGKEYEKKDTEIGAPFYLEQGVKDVVLFDPRTLEVTHRRRDRTTIHQSPIQIELQCGCHITI